ncbi:uncharacterized protein BCR38DRAFT_499304 [Pseudomassariella vexata]|uniref:Hpc2-related domain-containing protein n=1 Tax=Pseudomassariella vexata TaxID=1141098 RepID=A0A1Y2DHG6_9PEZI|nr:uncharacterized protein BCR38DRAFT_499304 [Pseudomassariella vexata]ORY58702.1 hypothetical protein BCR38DRAFT_499304 [Pseudomassariella vexata]
MTMAAPGDVPMQERYSSSPDLSDPPSGLSAPASPIGYGSNGGDKPGRQLDEIVVDHSNFRFDVSGQPVLTKDGVPRRKPGPKPGTKLKRNSNPDGSSADSVKARKPRKPRDPNAPPRKRKLASSADGEMSDSNTRSKATSASSRQSMPSILNADPEPQPRPSAPSRTSGTNYDPIRSNYDPVRETMVTHSYSNPMTSPRAPTNVVNRASASPSIASLVDPPASVQNIISPAPSHTTFAQSNTHRQPSHPAPHQETSSMPASPNPFRKEFAPPPKPAIVETKKPTPTPSLPTRAQISIRPDSITTIGAGSKRTPPKNHSTTSSSPRAGAQNEALAPISGGAERSILDFGKAEPGSELTVPSITLNIPLNGETNKYVNFMRMAEERYGWDALHPRQAEHRARKARIAAASAALAQNDSSREGDEMSVDESDNEDSNPGDKIKKKKRHFKEDEYDKEDDFVDDSEMLWEEQAAASRDGFFVYSGPLVPEVEKPEPGRGDGVPRRGRGSRGGRGSGRGTGSTRGTGRGGGPGSRGGVVRKPRMTKADKAQMDREKAEREAAFLKSTSGAAANYNVLHPGSPQFAGL